MTELPGCGRLDPVQHTDQGKERKMSKKNREYTVEFVGIMVYSATVEATDPEEAVDKAARGYSPDRSVGYGGNGEIILPEDIRVSAVYLDGKLTDTPDSSILGEVQELREWVRELEVKLLKESCEIKELKQQER